MREMYTVVRGDAVEFEQRRLRPMMEFMADPSTSVFDNVSSKSRSRTEHRRPLLTPDEVMRVGENEAIIRTGNRHPMRIAKSYYDEPP